MVFYHLIQFIIKNYYFYGNPLTPFFENVFSSNFLTYEKIKFSNYLKDYHLDYNNFYKYLKNILKIFIPTSLGSFFTIITPAIFLTFLIKYKKEDQYLFLIFGIILLINLIIGQHTARYYLVALIPFLFLISERFNFKFIYKLFLYFLCLPQILSIVFLLFNYYTLPKEKFLSTFVNEYNQIKWIEENIDEKYITDLRMNYYSNNKVNISLLNGLKIFQRRLLLTKVYSIQPSDNENMKPYSQIIFFMWIILKK